MSLTLYVWQRLTAAIMTPMIVVHIAVIFYATRHGVTAADILGRVRGNIGWGAFYTVFVMAASIHATVGIRNVLTEWSRLDDRRALITASGFGVVLLGLGLRAVGGLVLP
jgi:fumarate reductase subunit C